MSARLESHRSDQLAEDPGLDSAPQARLKIPQDHRMHFPSGIPPANGNTNVNCMHNRLICLLDLSVDFLELYGHIRSTCGSLPAVPCRGCGIFCFSPRPSRRQERGAVCIGKANMDCAALKVVPKTGSLHVVAF